MFSWKNIKDTYTEKVKNSDSTGDKTLGILEVVGKSIVSSVTVVVKELPAIANSMADSASDDSKKKATRVLNDSNSSHENKEKAQAYLDRHSEIKEKIRESKRNIKESSTGYFDQDNIRSREAECYSLKLAQLETSLENFHEKAKHYEEKKQKILTQLNTIVNEDQKAKEQETLDQLDNILTQYKLKIRETETEIEKFSKRLEGY